MEPQTACPGTDPALPAPLTYLEREAELRRLTPEGYEESLRLALIAGMTADEYTYYVTTQAEIRGERLPFPYHSSRVH